MPWPPRGYAAGQHPALPLNKGTCCANSAPARCRQPRPRTARSRGNRVRRLPTPTCSRANRGSKLSEGAARHAENAEPGLRCRRLSGSAASARPPHHSSPLSGRDELEPGPAARLSSGRDLAPLASEVPPPAALPARCGGHGESTPSSRLSGDVFFPRPVVRLRMRVGRARLKAQVGGAGCGGLNRVFQPKYCPSVFGGKFGRSRFEFRALLGKKAGDTKLKNVCYGV